MLSTFLVSSLALISLTCIGLKGTSRREQFNDCTVADDEKCVTLCSDAYQGHAKAK